jgi:phage N-6-adenine-methyltransferase
MIPLSLQNQLGKDIKSARKAQRLTQAALAGRTGLSLPSIRRLEDGRGNLRSWKKAVVALGLVLRGPNLPAGDSAGQRIATLRKRRKLGQREFAEQIGVTQATLVRLERYERGRVDTLERALVVLGAGARLVPESSQTAFYVAAGNSSAHHGWETPRELLKTLYTVFNMFDLDPCSPSHDRRTASVRAKNYYTMEDNGLALRWYGKVFVNPPYGRTLRQWTSKGKSEVETGNARIVIGLVPARTDTTWWHSDVRGHASVFFLRGRLCFGNSGQPAPFPSALVVWGGTPKELDAMRVALPDAMPVINNPDC